MKNHIKAGILSEKIFGKIILCAVLAAASAIFLSSCTVDEALTKLDSIARQYYATEEPAESSALPASAKESEAPEESVQPIAATAETEPLPTVDEPYAVTFAMPFLDKAHGGVDYKVTQSFSSTHGGLDVGVYWGAPILAATDGKVVYAYNDGDIPKESGDLRWTYGTFVVIESRDGIYRTYYAHMSRKTVSVGDTVKQGDVVGYSGNTGRVSSSSTGPYAGTHLHFEVRVLENGSYIKKDPKLFLPWWK